MSEKGLGCVKRPDTKPRECFFSCTRVSGHETSFARPFSNDLRSAFYLSPNASGFRTARVRLRRRHRPDHVCLAPIVLKNSARRLRLEVCWNSLAFCGEHHGLGNRFSQRPFSGIAFQRLCRHYCPVIVDQRACRAMPGGDDSINGIGLSMRERQSLVHDSGRTSTKLRRSGIDDPSTACRTWLNRGRRGRQRIEDRRAWHRYGRQHDRNKARRARSRRDHGIAHCQQREGGCLGQTGGGSRSSGNLR